MGNAHIRLCPVCRYTDTTENITFPQILLGRVEINSFQLSPTNINGITEDMTCH